MSRLRPKFCLNYLASVSKRASSLSSPQSKLNRHNPTRQLLRAAILWALVAGGVVIAPKSSFAQVRQVCYAIADGGRLDPAVDPGGEGTTDVLVQFSDSAADPVVNVGNIGTFNIESMAVQPTTGQIFAVDGGILGTVNPATGAFTTIGDSGLGDIDGLSFNSATGALFASVRTGAQDQLVQLNPATGAVSVAAVDIDTSGLAGLDDIDGITWDPTGTTLFGIANQGATSDQRLITITTGGVVTDIGSFGIDDVEDLSFDRLDNLRAVTGTSLSGADGEQVWIVNETTGAATAVRNIEIPSVAVDYEALDCIRLPVIDLALAKAVTPTTAAPNDVVTYTITVGNNAAVGTNPGGLPNIDDAEDIIVTDALPAGLTLSTITAPVPSQGTYDGSTGVWTVGNLADGATATLTITATVDAGTANGTINNFAQVTQDRDPADPLSDVVFFPGVDPFDIDSIPNNGTSPTPVEDDEGTAPLIINAGLSIGNVVFEDLNGNGVQDLGEPGVAGATVTLLDADNGNAVVGAPITTIADGAYSFTGLAAGNYIVQVASPAGFAPTLQDQGGDDATDSDINAAGQTAVIALAADDDTQDAGLIQPASVGDTVFLDVDGSNTFNAGDTPIQGVTVTLQDSTGAAVTDAAGNAVGPATTDISGNYLFSNLRPGDYQVIFSGAPVANGFVTADQGGDDTIDSDADATGTIAGITLTSGQVDPTRDAGIIDVPGLTIGNVIFEDLNGNGVQDLGEPGVAGATVTLLDADNGNAVVGAPVTTIADGAYSFTGLAAGNYIVQVTSPAGFAPTLQDQGGDDTADSDIDTTTGQTAVIALAADDNTQDAGLIQPASVGDTVFLDVDGSNTFNAGDTPIQGVTVTLQDSTGAAVTDAAGNAVGPATTDISGNYLFSNLRPGDYQVIFSGAPVANGFVTADQGGDDTIDSDADATGTIAGITLTSGQVDPTRDAGIVPGATGSLGDVVFLDSDNDGIQDVGEPGLAGIVVTLLDANGNPASDAAGNPIAPITTDSSGAYSFTDLPPGPYQISFDGSSQQLGLTQANQGTDDTVDSDADPATGLITGINLAAGTTLSNLDAGFVGASLGSLVFTDTDGDGIQDPGEPGQAGVTVTLEDENGNPVVDLAGNPVQPITTDATGIYSFTNLPPGNFQVRFDPGSTGLIFSTQDAGTDDTVDSDVNPDTGLISGVTLAVGQNLPDLDAGLSPAPQLTLVKRITAVRRNGVALAVPGANFNGVELDNPTLGNATLTAATLAQFDAVGLSPVGVQSLSDATELLPGDEVEYTIYFISSGQGTVGNAEVCDVLADRLDFSETGGITLTGAADSSSFLGGLVAVPTGTGAGRSCNVSQLGQQGAVVAELGDLPANEFGSVSFSAFIDAEQ